MRLLLDTHALIWWLTGNPRLSAAARRAIADPVNQVFASAVSGYEIAYKENQGNLLFPMPAPLATILRQAGFNALPIAVEHAEAASRLPRLHRDPWDRLLIAQARLARQTVVTVDPVFAVYGTPVLW